MAAVIVVRLLSLLFLVAASSTWEVSAVPDGQISPRRDRVKIPKNCPPCDVRQCSTLTPENCDGRIIKDRCQCCPICVEAEDGDSYNYTNRAELTTRNQSVSTMPAACNKIECPDYQMCVLNIQGIPMCRCPSSLYCKRQSRGRKVCGGDDVLYKSRCFLQIAECATSTKVGEQSLSKCFAEKQRKRKARKIARANNQKKPRKSKKPKRRNNKQTVRRKKKNKKKKKKRRKQRRQRKRRDRRRRSRKHGLLKLPKSSKKSRAAATKAADARRERRKRKRARRKERKGKGE
ncbi:hypothetical protein LSAT2_007287 [Lamellibrachia satsuma]|nr:hypothetical protein LSAT2_007287 [Lamellibrachia satsuma]